MPEWCHALYCLIDLYAFMILINTVFIEANY